ncbi:unnamed protein product [Sympodiomycopsis kandeliae]
MALNLDDLIGSMQHIHAGDRGQGIEEMRENLIATLGHEALGGTNSKRNISSSSSNSGSQRRPKFPNNRTGGEGNAPQNSYRDDDAEMNFQLHQQQLQAPSSSFVDADTTMQAISSNRQRYSDSSNHHQHDDNSGFSNGYGDRHLSPNHLNGGGHSVESSNSWGTNESSVSGAGSSGFGWNVQAPANTPQQPYQYHNNSHQSPQSHFSMMNSDQENNINSPSNNPRRLVNGFEPQQQSHHHFNQDQGQPQGQGIQRW